MEEKKLPGLDDKLSDVTDQFDDNSQAIMKQILKIMLEEKNKALMLVNDEFDKFSERIMQNFKAIEGNIRLLDHKISTVDLECAAVIASLVDNGTLTHEELAKKFEELAKQVQEAIQKAASEKETKISSEKAENNSKE